jgi:hypothetical protein
VLVDSNMITAIATIVGVIVTALGVIAAWLALRSKHKPSFKAVAKTAHNELNQAKKEKPTLDDPLSSNANEYQWTELSQSDGSCTFRADGYYVETGDPNYRFYLGPCDNVTVDNLLLEVQMKIIAGNEGGLIFCWHQTLSEPEFYYFYITTDGSYGLEQGKPVGFQDKHEKMHQSSSKAIHRGLYQVNTIAVNASADSIDLFANKEFLVHLRRTSPDAGIFGFASGPHPSKVVFSYAKMWRRP